MTDYEKYMKDEDFGWILDYLRDNCLASADQVADGTDIDYRIVEKYFDIAQAIVSVEIEEGHVVDTEGVAMLRKMQAFYRLP